jgi:hypothetical protein
MTDIIGNDIFKGAVVAYGVRSGNSGDLHLGVIADPETLEVVPLVKEYWNKPDRRIGRRSTLSGPERLACIPFTYIPDKTLCDLIMEVRRGLGL